MVCGAAKHVETLHVALEHLARFSERPAFVVTDPRRNEIPVDHPNIVAVSTPEALSDHQAAIYLKTGLHRIFTGPGPYCYLDSDVLAVRPGVDSIFSHKLGPVVFGSDHCPISEFSPHAVNCACSLPGGRLAPGATRESMEAAFAEREARKRLHYELSEALHAHVRGDREKEAKKELLDVLTTIYNQNMARAFWNRIPPILAGPLRGLSWRLFLLLIIRGRYRWSERERRWYDRDGSLMIDAAAYERFVSEVRERCGFSWDERRGAWLDDEGRNVYPPGEGGVPRCGHLQQAILDRFGVAVPDGDWVHYNGGVFLFGPDSFDFMETWRRLCLEIFDDPYWRTRDQGVLAAVTWKFGLEDAPRLPPEFNFIADYYKKGLTHHGDLRFSLPGSTEVISPRLLHVYHNFGRRDWSVWRDVEKTLA